MSTNSVMAQIYARKVESGTWKLEDVPALWRKQVETILEKQSGKPTN